MVRSRQGEGSARSQKLRIERFPPPYHPCNFSISDEEQDPSAKDIAANVKVIDYLNSITIVG